MRRTGLVIALVLLFPLLWPATARSATKEVAACIRNPRCNQLFVVPHRARGFEEPENSLAALKKTVEAGTAVIEIDLRVSSDGELFLLHDERLDRTASKRGRLNTRSSEELGKILLSSGESLPRFEDAYAITRGKSVLVLDFKENVVEAVARWIAQNGSFDDAIFFVNTREEMAAAARAKRKYPALLVMARAAGLQEIEYVERLFETFPEIIHTGLPTHEEAEKIRSRGSKIFVKASEADRFQGYFRSWAWRWIFGLSADFVLTDDPSHPRQELKKAHASYEKSYRFGVVYENKLLRSRAPSKEFLRYLGYAYGINTIVDLRNPKSHHNENDEMLKEKEWAEELGITYVIKTVRSATAEDAAGFVRKLTAGNNDRSVLIHCQYGKDRTGAVVAFLRLQDGWNYESALAEMKSFGHDPRGHGLFHHYLKEFLKLQE